MTRKREKITGVWLDEASNIDPDLWRVITSPDTDSWVRQYFVQPEPSGDDALTKDLLLYGTAAVGPDGQRIPPAELYRQPNDEGDEAQPFQHDPFKLGDIGRN